MRGLSGLRPLRGNDFPKPLRYNVWSKIIMAFLQSLSSADLQTLTFPRRELPGKLLAITLALLLPKPQREVSVTPIEVQPKPQPEVLAIPTETQPKFKIGDLVAEDWVNEEDKVDTEFGQVLGMAYFKKAQSCFEANTWVYYVNWTHSTSDADFAYPTYDQEPSRESDLRLVIQS
jgi:hypothetical protein